MVPELVVSLNGGSHPIRLRGCRLTLDEARRLRDLLTEAIRLIEGGDRENQGLGAGRSLDRFVDHRLAS
jgi:hypothetical protein